MVYLLQGDVKTIFAALNLQKFIAINTQATRSIFNDLNSSLFLGSTDQAQHFTKLWRATPAMQHYHQGDMTALNLDFLLGTPPFIKTGETHAEHKKHFVCNHFAYVNAENEPCGLIYMFRKDEPKKWAVGLIKNTHLPPEKRTLMLLSGVAFKSQLLNKPLNIYMTNLSTARPDFLKQLKYPLLELWIEQALNIDNETFNLRCNRLFFLLRFLGNTSPDGFNPPGFHRILLSSNSALDLIAERKLFLSIKAIDSVASGMNRNSIPVLLELGLQSEDMFVLTCNLSEEGRRFRHVITLIDEQRKLYKDFPTEWNIVNQWAGRIVSELAFEALTKKNVDLKAKIDEIEQAIFKIANPETQSWFYLGLIWVVNLLITVFTLGLANIIKESSTGNPGFFNLTPFEEQIHKVDNEIVDVVMTGKSLAY